MTHYNFLPEKECVVSIEIRNCDDVLGNIFLVHGKVSADEYIAALKKHLAQDKDRLSKYRFTLADFQGATEMNFSREAIEEITNLCIASAQQYPNIAIAVVANSTLIFALSRMWEMMMEGESGWECRVFKSKDDAKDWIRQKLNSNFGIDHLTFEVDPDGDPAVQGTAEPHRLTIQR